MQERAIARGTVVVFDIITSVGNLFLTFDTLMKVRTVGLCSKQLNLASFVQVVVTDALVALMEVYRVLRNGINFSGVCV